MSSFSVNLNLGTSGKLDKLFDDASVGNTTYQQGVTTTSTSGDLLNLANNNLSVNSNGVETIDLSATVQESKSGGVNNNITTSSVSSGSNTNSASLIERLNNSNSQNNINLNGTNSTNNTSATVLGLDSTNANTEATSVSTNSGINNGTSSSNNNLNLDTSLNLNNINSDDSLSINSDFTDETSTTTSTTGSLGSNSLGLGGSELDDSGLDLDIGDIGIGLESTNISNDDSISISTSESDENGNSSTSSMTIETLDDYIELLSSYGFIEEDINRIINSEITLEDLYSEIVDDEDTTRLRYLLEVQYLNSFGLEYSSLEELENAMNVDRIQMMELVRLNGGEIDEEELARLYEITEMPETTLSISSISDSTIMSLEELSEELSTYQQYYDLVNQQVEYYLNVLSYSEKSDFKDNCYFNFDSGATLNGIINTSSYNYHIDDREELVAVLSCVVNNYEGIVSSGRASIKLKSSDNILSNYIEWADIMTGTEIATFNYLYNTEGYEAAYDYLTELSATLDTRWLAEQTELDQELASEYPVIASFASILITPIEGLSSIAASLNSLITNQEIMRYQVYSAGDVWRSQVATDITENYGETAGFIYSTGMSMADSAILMGLSAATGGMGAVTVVISAATMGSRAYVSTINDALDRGLSDGAAVGLAFTSAVIETACESYSAGHLLNLESKLGNVVSKLTTKVSNLFENEAVALVATKGFYVVASALSQGLVEGEEELCTEILNYVADYKIAGDLSNYSLTLQTYLESGMSEEEAWRSTMKDFSSQAIQAFLGGFVSGCVFGAFGGTYSSNKISSNIASGIYDDFVSGNSAQQFAQVVEENQNTLSSIENSEKKESLSKIKEIFSSITKSDSEINYKTISGLKYKSSGLIEYMSNYLTSNIRKYVYSNTNNFVGLNESIETNGLYHFTSESGADSILSSGYIKASSLNSSYYIGGKKTFFFNGIAEVGAIASNIDALPVKTVAIKVNPTSDILNNSNLTVRNMDDAAISWKGNFSLEGQEVSKVYMTLTQVGDQLQYVEVSESDYQNYETTEMGEYIASLVSDKSNIRIISDDFLENIIFDKTKKISSILAKTLSDNTSSLNVQTNENFSDIIDADYINGHMQTASNLNNDMQILTKEVYDTKIKNALKDYNSLGKFIEEMNNYTDEMVVEFGSVENLKKTFINQIIADGSIENLNNSLIYQLTTDSTILTELVGTKYLDKLLISNLCGKGGGLISESLSNLSIEELNQVFSTSTMVNWLQEIDDEKFSLIIQNLSKDNANNWLRIDSIAERITSMDISNFAELSMKNINVYLNISPLLKSDNYDNYLKILSKMNQMFDVDTIIQNPQYYNVIESWISPVSGRYSEKSPSLEKLVSDLKSKKYDAKITICEKLNQNGIVTFDLPNISNILGTFAINGVDTHSYYDLNYEVDGKTYVSNIKTMMENNYLLIRFDESDINAIMSGDLTVKSFVKNEVDSSLYLSASDGISKGLNKITLVVDGKIETVLVNNVSGTADLNDYFPNASTVDIINIENVNSYDVKNAEKNTSYTIRYKVDGIEQSILTTSSYSVLDRGDVVKVDEILAKNNLYNATDITVEKSILSEDSPFEFSISKYSASDSLFTDNHYGGNQSEVASIINRALTDPSSLSDVDSMKANDMLNLLRSIYPNATDIELINLTKAYAGVGCCYMAVANAVATYMGSLDNGSELFKNAFGYNLSYGENNSYNVETIALDLFLYKSDTSNIKTTINTASGVSLAELRDGIFKNYFENKKLKFQVDDIIIHSNSVTGINSELMAAIYNGVNSNAMSILMGRGFDLESLNNYSNLETSDQALSNATIDGSVVKNVGRHAMLVTGINSVGDIVISSWAGKYKFIVDDTFALRRSKNTAQINIANVKFSILNN